MQSTRGTIIISTCMIMLGDRKPTLTCFLNIVGRYVSGSEGATGGLSPEGWSVRNPHRKPASAPYEAGFPSQKAGSKSSIATALDTPADETSSSLQH
eukprot:scaffold5525_cov120-Skeletonema_marinoi.AAC.7